jgi:DNA-binding transcriptional ArsR family regulator
MGANKPYADVGHDAPPAGSSPPHFGMVDPMENGENLPGGAKRASDLLKALAHESRLVILCILADGEKSVTELEHELDLRQPTVSQQLARLRADGLVSTRRQGKAIYYRLDSDEARQIVESIRNLFSLSRN